MHATPTAQATSQKPDNAVRPPRRGACEHRYRIHHPTPANARHRDPGHRVPAPRVGPDRPARPAYVVNYADKAVSASSLSRMARELGLTSAQIGLVGSLFFLAFTIGGFFAGADQPLDVAALGLVVLARAGRWRCCRWCRPPP